MGKKIRCPCNHRRCQNTRFLDVPTVKLHLAKYGFVPDYYVWIYQGESHVRVDVDRDVGGPSSLDTEEPSNAYHTMVMDAACPEFNVDEIEESPNPEAQQFFDMLKAAVQDLWPGCKKHSQLSLVARLMNLKSLPSSLDTEEPSNAYHTMVMDAACPEFNVDEIEESPNPEAQQFFDMLKAAVQDLWPGCKKHSQLSLVARLMNLKSLPSSLDTEEPSNAYHTMVMDAACPEFNVDEIEESPNPEAQQFFDMLKAAVQDLWPGCKKHSQLSLVARLMNLKSENHISEKCFNQITELMKEIVLEENLIPENFYSNKRLLRDMGLPVEKIDCCKNNCMIYWGSDLYMTKFGHKI